MDNWVSLPLRVVLSFWLLSRLRIWLDNSQSPRLLHNYTGALLSHQKMVEAHKHPVDVQRAGIILRALHAVCTGIVEKYEQELQSEMDWANTAGILSVGRYYANQDEGDDNG